MVDVGSSHTLDGQSGATNIIQEHGGQMPQLSVMENDAHHGLQRAVADPLSELKDLSGFQVFWRDRKFLFSEDFRNYYENEVLPAQAHTKFDYQ